MSDRVPPGHLTGLEAAAWGEIAARWPDGQDMPSGPRFEAYLGQVARLRSAQAAISSDGLIVENPKGDTVPHPAIAVERAAQAEIRAWGSTFEPTTGAGW